VSRAVAQGAATQSGLDPGLLRKMLPMLAMLVTGLMARHAAWGAGSQPTSSEGGLGGLLGGLLGGQMGGAGGGAASGDQPGSGLPGLASMLDLDGDGNPLDDLMQMAGKALG
jgi:hypothetical protein